MTDNLKSRWKKLMEKVEAAAAAENLTDEEIEEAVTEAIEEVRLEKALKEHTAPGCVLEKQRCFRARLTADYRGFPGHPAPWSCGVVETLPSGRHLFWHKGKYFPVYESEFEGV